MLLETSATLLGTGALLVVRRTLLGTSATLLGTGALLVVRRTLLGSQIFSQTLESTVASFAVKPKSEFVLRSLFGRAFHPKLISP